MIKFIRKALVDPKTLRFILVGVVATIIYAGLALAFDAAFAMPGVFASLMAYLLAGVFSYIGHQYFTFRHKNVDHTEQVRKFIAVNMFGYGLSTALPLLMHDYLEIPMIWPVALTSVGIPLVNFLALNFFVFKEPVSVAEAQAE